MSVSDPVSFSVLLCTQPQPPRPCRVLLPRHCLDLSLDGGSVVSFPELVAHIPVTLVSSDFDPADPPSSLQTASDLHTNSFQHKLTTVLNSRPLQPVMVALSIASSSSQRSSPSQPDILAFQSPSLSIASLSANSSASSSRISLRTADEGRPRLELVMVGLTRGPQRT